MGLDADLGIDSIKRVEILSALQERLPGSPRHRPGASRHPAHPGRDRRHLGAGSQPVAARCGRGHHVGRGSCRPRRQTRRGNPARGGEREDRLSGGDARPRHGARRRPRHRLHQTGGDSLRPPGAPPRLTRHRPGASRHAPHPRRDRPAPGRRAGTGPAQAPPQAEPATLQPSAPKSMASADVPAIGRNAVIPVPLGCPAGSDDIPVAADGKFWVTDDGSAFTAELCAALRARGLDVNTIAAHEIQAIAPAGKIAGFIISAPITGTDDLFLENAFLLMQSAAPDLQQAEKPGGPSSSPSRASTARSAAAPAQPSPIPSPEDWPALPKPRAGSGRT